MQKSVDCTHLPLLYAMGPSKESISKQAIHFT